MTISIKLYGRLGNQLFQYALIRSISLKNNCDFIITTGFSYDGQKCLLEFFNIDKSKIDKENIHIRRGDDVAYISKNFINKYCYQEKKSPYDFDINVFNQPDGTLFDGFFQNGKYFDFCKNIILKEISLKDEYYIFGKNYIDNLKNDYQKIVGIHIRRGDMTWCSTFNEKKVINFINKIINTRHLDTDKIKLLFFIGGCRSNDYDNDYTWVKKNFSYKNMLLVETKDPIKDFSILSQCDINILPKNSTFAWWAAYINKNNYKQCFIDITDSDWKNWKYRCDKFIYC